MLIVISLSLSLTKDPCTLFIFKKKNILISNLSFKCMCCNVTFKSQRIPNFKKLVKKIGDWFRVGDSSMHPQGFEE